MQAGPPFFPTNGPTAWWVNVACRRRGLGPSFCRGHPEAGAQHPRLRRGGSEQRTRACSEGSRRAEDSPSPGSPSSEAGNDNQAQKAGAPGGRRPARPWRQQTANGLGEVWCQAEVGRAGQPCTGPSDCAGACHPQQATWRCAHGHARGHRVYRVRAYTFTPKRRVRRACGHITGAAKDSLWELETCFRQSSPKTRSTSTNANAARGVRVPEETRGPLAIGASSPSTRVLAAGGQGINTAPVAIGR